MSDHLDDMPLAEVIALPGVIPPDAGPLVRKKVDRYGPDACRHPQTVIDAEAHTLTCANKACGQLLDPWEVLDRYAREHDAHVQRYESAKRQAAAAIERLANLERVEKLTKGRIAAAERRTPTADLILRCVLEIERHQGDVARGRGDREAAAAWREESDRLFQAFRRARERYARECDDQYEGRLA